MITSIEAKKMMMAGVPIVYDGIEYERITAIIYQKINDKFVACVQLKDKNSKSVSIVRLDFIEREKQKNALISIDTNDEYYQELNKEIRQKFFEMINSLGRGLFKDAQEACENLSKIALEFNDVLKAKIKN